MNSELAPDCVAGPLSPTRRDFLKTMAAGLATSALLGHSPRAGHGEQQPASADRRPTALVLDEVSKYHLTGPNRPECPQRYEVVLNSLRKNSCFSGLKSLEPRPATAEEIRSCHAESYVARVRRDVESGCQRLSTGDTSICRDSLKAAYYAAGAACVAVDAVLGGQAKNAFCLVRPPGQHATANRGMGFCIFNNVAIAARYAQHKYHVNKVLIVDWDVHHGNGTQDIFYEDGSVFFFSTHQWPWYPGTGRADEIGAGKGIGTTLNCPFPAGAGRKEIVVEAFQGKLLPAADRFRPELVLISAGFDARHDDPLGGFRLTDDDFAELTAIVLDIARRHAGGRLISVLEGGYNLSGLAAAADSHIRTLSRACV